MYDSSVALEKRAHGSCVTFFLCDPGYWYVKSCSESTAGQNKWDGKKIVENGY